MIQAIAVDMDGTFLRPDNTYDNERFANLFKRFQEHQIHFIVASGNQYYQLKSFFPEHEDQLTFVSENGALIFEQGRLLRSKSFSPERVERILTFIAAHELDLDVIVCGIDSAYILKETPQAIRDFSRVYYHRLKELDSFDELPSEDRFVKFALDLPIDRVAAFVTEMNDVFKDEIKAVASGHGSVDIIIPGMNKGAAIQWLLDRWHVSPEHLAAFGDANNDLEMLGLTPNSYAMAASSPAVIETAKHRAPSNNDSGVMVVLEQLLEEQNNEA